MFRRFLRHKIIRDKDLLLTFPKPPIFPRLLPGTSVGNVTIEKTTGVCGGAARIAGTRIPVWQLVAARETGASEGQVLMDFPRLEARNLVDAWAYAADHPKEIRAQIHANEVA
ncbi:MAG: DUF433 domain-containing protein [Isosphaeraceae bacterium]